MVAKKQIIKPTTKDLASSVKKSAATVPDKSDQTVNYDYGVTLSTGSTLLDLAISGDKCRYGGIPGGVIVEIYGPSSAGKSSVLAEIGASAQVKGGEVAFKDPEARMDARYCKTYGLNIDPKTYSKPDTVSEVFAELEKWKPTATGVINAVCVDSLAALSTDLELEKGDKMGMRRAKEFSEGFRKHCRRIERNNWIMACSNQLRQGEYGETTPGGNAAGYYASLRISIRMVGKVEISRDFKVGAAPGEFDEDAKTSKDKKKITRAIGIESLCTITKSTVGKPFRTAPLFITFGHGVDDIRGNLQFIKDTNKASTYLIKDKSFNSMVQAIDFVERNNLEDEIREQTVDLWHAVDAMFNIERKPKIRR